MSSIQSVISHLQSVSKSTKSNCTMTVGGKIKIISCDLLNKRITFALPVTFSGQDIDSVVDFSSDVLVAFRQEYFDKKLPYKIENGLKVQGELNTIEATELIKGEVVVSYTLKIELNLGK